ncbi:MAG: arginase family protein [Chloroflexi bacterium]|nr:arginase family protein [Chloroflexota bacterium]
MDKVSLKKALYTLGIATDLGLETPGAKLAPSVLFQLLRVNEKLAKLGSVIETSKLPENIIADDIKALVVGGSPNKEERIERIANLCHRTARQIQKDLDQVKETHESYHALFLGGDHSIAMGTYAGVANHLAHKLGVLWIDAHGDFNVWKTTDSKNIHGMALASILGQVRDGEENMNDEKSLFDFCLTEHRPSPDDIVIWGARKLDDKEIDRLRYFGIKVYSATDIERITLREIMDRIVDKFKAKRMKVHVSLDLDAIDPKYAPGVSTPVNGGITDRELFYIAETLNLNDLVFSLDVVEYNITEDDKIITAEFAAEAILHFFGKTYSPNLSR